MIISYADPYPDGSALVFAASPVQAIYVDAPTPPPVQETVLLMGDSGTAVTIFGSADLPGGNVPIPGNVP